jgi:hypothetical protein
MNAAADAPGSGLAGEYRLVSSTNAPAGSWRYAKAPISIRQLDERHFLILLACAWQNAPKAMCGDYLYAQSQDQGLYMQDMNTDALRLYFDPATRTLTMISRGFDNKLSVRRDVFAPAEAAPGDEVLSRRMTRMQVNAESKENLRVFGHYSKWDYTKNRIEFQSNP